MEQYYLIKKEDVDKLKSSLPNKLEDNYDAGKFAALSMIGLELGKVIDLSDEAIESKAEVYGENAILGSKNPYTAYSQALKDLKQELNNEPTTPNTKA